METKTAVEPAVKFLKFTGTIPCRGQDIKTGELFSAIKGDVVPLSPEHAQRLKLSEPELWSESTEKEHTDAMRTRSERSKKLELEVAEKAKRDEAAARNAAATTSGDDDDE